MADSLDREIKAYEIHKTEMEKHHLYKFVIFHDEKFEGAFDSFDAAARDAVQRFGRGPYLIRQVGIDTHFPMPASVAYRALHATS